MTDYEISEAINAAGLVAGIVFGLLMGLAGVAIWMGWV